MDNGDLPGALAVYERLLTSFPRETGYLVWAGRLSRWLGQSEAAIEYLDRVLEADSTHVEARIERAYVLMAQQQLAAARELLRPLAGSQRGNPDFLMAMAQLSRYGGDNPAALDYIAQILRIQADHPEALDLERNVTAALAGEPRFQITVGYGHDRFAFASPAHSGELNFAYTGDRTRLDLRTEVWDKLGNRTQRVGPSISHRFGNRLWVRGSAMWSRNARALPAESFGGGMSWLLGSGWVASGDYRQLRFEDPVVHVLSPSVEYYLESPASIRISFYRSWTRHRASTTPAFADSALAIQYNHEILRRVTGFAAYARGNESFGDLSIDRIGSVGANTYTLGGILGITDRLSSRVYYSHRQVSSGGDQNSFGVSLTILE
jgi:YaiO family outer membrane protein